MAGRHAKPEPTDVAAMADEVERDLPTYKDHEEAYLPVPVLRELLRRAAARAA